jgi:hypothetical protein
MRGHASAGQSLPRCRWPRSGPDAGRLRRLRSPVRPDRADVLGLPPLVAGRRRPPQGLERRPESCRSTSTRSRRSWSAPRSSVTRSCASWSATPDGPDRTRLGPPDVRGGTLRWIPTSAIAAGGRTARPAPIRTDGRLPRRGMGRAGFWTIEPSSSAWRSRDFQAGLSWATILHKRDGLPAGFRRLRTARPWPAFGSTSTANACWPTPGSCAIGPRSTPRSANAGLVLALADGARLLVRLPRGPDSPAALRPTRNRSESRARRTRQRRRSRTRFRPTSAGAGSASSARRSSTASCRASGWWTTTCPAASAIRADR